MSDEPNVWRDHDLELSGASLRSPLIPESSPETQRLLEPEETAEAEGWAGEQDFSDMPIQAVIPPGRLFTIRAIALLCACFLSIGSHYATYILGPLKSRLNRELGTSNTEFSLLISAFSLNGSWTPLVGGILASRLGTTYTSILATGVIFLGQVLLLIGEVSENTRLMTFGLFIFGLGPGPLSVVQETIIVRFFKSHNLGISLALGLVAGKGASFVSARTSYPLSERYGRHAPFYVATALAGLSVLVNLLYISISKWLIQGTGARMEASEIEVEARRASLSRSEAEALEKVAAKRKVNLKEVVHLDNVFWAYVGLNVLCGVIWAPFTHLASNIIQQRYSLSERTASTQASYLLAFSMALYPICGWIMDRFKTGKVVLRLFVISSVLQLFCYCWLALPPSWTNTAMPGIVSFGLGIGSSTLLLVAIVPYIVPLKYVPTTLGTHKSMEHTGAVIMQTLAGLVLDTKKSAGDELPTPSKPSRAGLLNIQYLLNTFVAFNILQLLALLVLARLGHRQRMDTGKTDARHSEESLVDQIERVQSTSSKPTDEESPRLELLFENIPLPSTSLPNQRVPLLEAHRSYLREGGASTPSSPLSPTTDVPLIKTRQMRRGEVYAGLCLLLIVFAWTLFLVTAWIRLRSKADRGLPSA